MEILGRTIPPPPPDCPDHEDCMTDVRMIKIFADYVPPSHFADVPADPAAANTADGTPSGTYPAEIIAGIIHALERGRPMERRCSDCIARCALAAVVSGKTYDIAV